VAHKADPWIAKSWLGKIVKQISSCDGPSASDKSIGRISIVTDTFFDEKGALHCLTEDGRWCPAARLEIIPQA